MQYLKVIGLVLLVACGFSAQAHEKGDFIVRGGLANVSPNEDSDRIDIAGLAVLDGVTVDANTQLGLTFTYMLTSNVGVTLLAATPFEHCDRKCPGQGWLDKTPAADADDSVLLW